MKRSTEEKAEKLQTLVKKKKQLPAEKQKLP